MSSVRDSKKSLACGVNLPKIYLKTMGQFGKSVSIGFKAHSAVHDQLQVGEPSGQLSRDVWRGFCHMGKQKREPGRETANCSDVLVNAIIRNHSQLFLPIRDRCQLCRWIVPVSPGPKWRFTCCYTAELTRKNIRGQLLQIWAACEHEVPTQ